MEVEVVGKRFEGVVVRKEVGKISVAEPRREGLARQAVTAMGVYQMVYFVLPPPLLQSLHNAH